jgi:hypothetical protein
MELAAHPFNAELALYLLACVTQAALYPAYPETDSANGFRHTLGANNHQRNQNTNYQF